MALEPIMIALRQLEWFSCTQTLTLVGITASAVVGLADHGRVAVGGSILLRGVQAWVDDVIGSIRGIREAPRTRRCNWPSGWTGAGRASNGAAGVVPTACRTVLMLSSRGLGLQIRSAVFSSRQTTLSPVGARAKWLDALHKSYLAVFR